LLVEVPLRPTLALTLAVLCASAPGTAQAPPGSVQAGLELGSQFGGAFASGSDALFTRTVRMKNCTLKGFWFGTQLTAEWGLEVATRRSSTRFLLPDPSTLTPLQQGAWFEYAVMELAAVRTYRFGRLQPYWLVGAGVANLNLNVTDKAYRDTNRASLGGGAGIRFWLADWAALRLDLRAHAAYLQVRQDGQDHGALDPGRWLRTEDAMLGVQFSY
jgi:hypothetical protein